MVVDDGFETASADSPENATFVKMATVTLKAAQGEPASTSLRPAPPQHGDDGIYWLIPMVQVRKASLWT